MTRRDAAMLHPYFLFQEEYEYISTRPRKRKPFIEGNRVTFVKYFLS